MFSLALGDLHFHDLCHTVGMHLREAGVSEGTRADTLWYSTPSMTHHYRVAQIVELHAALEKVKDDNGHWNKRADGEVPLPQKSTGKEKQLRGLRL
ncbi:MAG: hypothetical protein ABI605_13085 [Rhizobacter sp.]